MAANSVDVLRAEKNFFRPVLSLGYGSLKKDAFEADFENADSEIINAVARVVAQRGALRVDARAMALPVITFVFLHRYTRRSPF